MIITIRTLREFGAPSPEAVVTQVAGLLDLHLTTYTVEGEFRVSLGGGAYYTWPQVIKLTADCNLELDEVKDMLRFQKLEIVSVEA